MRAEVDAVDDIGLILACGEAGGLAVGGDFGERVDRRAAGLLILGGVGVNRDEQVGLQAARDAVAFLKHQIAVVRAGERDADAARGDQVVANRARDAERDVLFALAAVRIDRARIVPAVPRVDHDERQARIGRPLDFGQRDRGFRFADRHRDAVAFFGRLGAELRRSG